MQFNKKIDKRKKILVDDDLTLPIPKATKKPKEKNPEKVKTVYSRNWCFTRFKNIGGDLEYSRTLRYVIYQTEISPTTGKEHDQGYAEFKDPVSMKHLQGIAGDNTMHCEVRKGTRDEARQYCAKESSRKPGTTTYQWGTWELAPGKRNDIQGDVLDIVRNGGNMRQVLDRSTSLQAAKHAEMVLKYTEPKRRFEWKDVEYIWIYGDPGTGKSHHAEQYLKQFCDEDDIWWSGRDAKWWNEYDGHEYIILDDIRGDFAKYHELLRILDVTPYTIEVKGSFRQLRAKKIIITSPMPPWNAYPNVTENLWQLGRRLTKVLHCMKIGDEHVMCQDKWTEKVIDARLPEEIVKKFQDHASKNQTTEVSK